MVNLLVMAAVLTWNRFDKRLMASSSSKSRSCFTYEALSGLTPRRRKKVVHEVCRLAKIRMPETKAQYILGSFDYVKSMGGPERAKELLLAQPDRDAKIKFLKTFPGIGPKYARNIMMDVYHPQFLDNIAIDVRIKSISKVLGLTFTDANYSAHEAFYVEVAHMADLNGWELDRFLIFPSEQIASDLRFYVSIHLPGEGPNPFSIKRNVSLLDGCDLYDGWWWSLHRGLGPRACQNNEQ